MADLKVGTSDVSKVMYGSQTVSKVYLGSTLVWEASAAPTPAFEGIINFDSQFVGGAGVNYTNIPLADTTSGSVTPIINISDGIASNITWQKTSASGTGRDAAHTSATALGGYDLNSIKVSHSYAGMGGFFYGKLAGLDTGKTYTIKVVSIFNANNGVTTITVGGSSQSKGDIANELLTWTGVSPDGNGEIAILSDIVIMGSFNFGGAFNIIHIIEE